MTCKRFLMASFCTVQIFGASPIYLFNLGYEAPDLVAPAFILIIPRGQTMNLQIGIIGWTVMARGEYAFHKYLTVGISQNFTPMNSNASIYRYSDGHRNPDLDYKNSTQLVESYIRKKRTRNWTSQYSLIYLNEKVKDTDYDSFWEKPHAGISATETWRSVEYEDFFNNRWDGFKLAGQIQMFPWGHSWYRGKLSAGFGLLSQPWYWNVSGKLFFSENLNVVNQFIVGGLWELEPLNFMQGSHYGEYRIDEGLLFNVMADRKLTEATELGARMSLLRAGNESYFGYGLKMITIYEGIVLNVGLSISDKALKNRDLNNLIFATSLTFGFM